MIVWCRPRDCEIRVIVSDAHIAAGSVKFINSINDIRDTSECLETVQEPARDIHLRADLIIEQERHHLADADPGRGVDDHVEHGAIGAAHQLCLTSPGSAVQSTGVRLGRTVSMPASASIWTSSVRER
jgi:hypothetical protein